MENSGWTPVAVRLFAFSLLPVLLAALHVRLVRGREIGSGRRGLPDLSVRVRGRRGRAQRLLRSCLHARYRRGIDRLADGESVPAGDGFREPRPRGSGIHRGCAKGRLPRSHGDRRHDRGVGATVVHTIDMIQEGNLAPGNSIQNIGNLLKPALLISLLIVSRRTEREEGRAHPSKRAGPSSRRQGWPPLSLAPHSGSVSRSSSPCRRC